MRDRTRGKSGSAAVVTLLFAALLLTLPMGGVRLPQVEAFVPMIDAIMFVGDLITAALIFAQAEVFRSRALTALGAGYVYEALLLIPHALTFPGAFAPNGLLDAGPNTAAWLALFRRVVFPVTVILYAQLKRADGTAQFGPERSAVRIVVGVLAAIVLAAAATLLAIHAQGLLPPYYLNQSVLIYANQLGYEAIVFSLLVVATAALFRTRNSVVDLWLLVAVVASLIQSVLITTLQGRFTAGWYLLYLLALFSHLVVMLALIAEFSRLLARLVLATSARNRERDARLMSLDALAATISHEIGQPLTAVGLHARVGLKRLTGAAPDVESAIRAQRDTLEAWRRTQDVLKSIRSMFAERPTLPVEFSLNELVRATTSLVAGDLAARKVSLDLQLDETLPPILADQVEIQRVLVNLLTNAIDSLGATRGRPRRIEIRSTTDSQDVFLAISDNGVGIEIEKMTQIFDAFFTTKPTGTGLGLGLCRTIVEGCGGHLWASQGAEHGVTFHLQFPRSRLSEL